MYLRNSVWQNVLAVTAESTSGWVNQFTINTLCLDIKFGLIGYGWKPNLTDQNIPILYQGEYRCYYRKTGSGDPWTEFARATSDRAPTSDPYVYQDIIVETGVIEEGIYDIKIEANSAKQYESWGGTIEDIEKGKQFYFDLMIRADQPIKINPVEQIAVSDVLDIARDIIYLAIVDEILAFDFLENYNIGHQIQTQEDIVNIVEYRSIFFHTYRQVFDVISTAEYTAFWTNLLHMVTPVDATSVEDIVTGMGLPWLLPGLKWETILIEEWIWYGLTPLLASVTDPVIVVEDYLDGLWPMPPWRPRPFDSVAIVESMSYYAWRWFLDDECAGTITPITWLTGLTSRATVNSVITGSGTAFLSELAVNDYIITPTLNPGKLRVVSVDSNVQITVSGASDQAWSSKYLGKWTYGRWSQWVESGCQPDARFIYEESPLGRIHAKISNTVSYGYLMVGILNGPYATPFGPSEAGMVLPALYDVEVKLIWNSSYDNSNAVVRINFCGLILELYCYEPEAWGLRTSYGEVITDAATFGRLRPNTDIIIRVKGIVQGSDGEADVWLNGIFLGRWRHAASSFVQWYVYQSGNKTTWAESWLDYIRMIDLTQQGGTKYLYRLQNVTITEVIGVSII